MVVPGEVGLLWSFELALVSGKSTSWVLKCLDGDGLAGLVSALWSAFKQASGACPLDVSLRLVC